MFDASNLCKRLETTLKHREHTKVDGLVVKQVACPSRKETRTFVWKSEGHLEISSFTKRYPPLAKQSDFQLKHFEIARVRRVTRKKQIIARI